jgi:hypothetical protein
LYHIVILPDVIAQAMRLRTMLCIALRRMAAGDGNLAYAIELFPRHCEERLRRRNPFRPVHMRTALLVRQGYGKARTPQLKHRRHD